MSRPASSSNTNVSAALLTALVEGLRGVVRRVERIAAGASMVAVAVLGLLLARQRIPDFASSYVQRTFPRKLADEVIWNASTGFLTGEIGQTQWITYLAALAVPLGAAFVWAVVDRLLAWNRPTRVVSRVLRVGVIGAAVVVGFKMSSFAGAAAIALIASIGWLISPTVHGEVFAGERFSVREAAGLTLTCAGLSLAWAIWLVWWKTFGIMLFSVAFPLVGWGLYRVGRSYASPDGERAIGTDAVACAPLLLLPLLAFVREPSFRWIAIALIACVALRALGEVRSLLPSLKTVTALAPWAVCALFAAPLQWRDLPDANHYKHEGMHLGWVSAVLDFKKLLMADTGFYYGPARGYLMAAWTAITSMTLEQMRVVYVLVNLVGIAALLLAGYWASGAGPVPHAFFAYLLMTRTSAVVWLDYRKFISFGWGDLSRLGWAALALVATLRVACAIPTTTIPDRRTLLKLAAGGAGTAAAALYSQEFGLAAFASFGLAIIIEALARPEGLSLGKRAWRAVLIGGSYALGFLLVVAVFVSVYAARGKAKLFFEAYMTLVRVTSAGVYPSHVIPVSLESFNSWGGLMKNLDGTMVIEWVVPAVLDVVAGLMLIAAFVRRHWTPRSTLLTALLLFSVSSYRGAVHPPDVYHLMQGGGPHVLLAAALMGEAIRFCTQSTVRRRIGVLAFAAVALGTIGTTEQLRGLTLRADLVAKGLEVPSTGLPYANPGLPRAGDVNIPGSVRDIVKYIEDNTAPDEGILFRMQHTIEGAEYHFLAKRRNPTRFTIDEEMLVLAHQAEFVESLKKDPPKLIFGESAMRVGPAVDAYIREHWTRVGEVGGYPVWRYKGT